MTDRVHFAPLCPGAEEGSPSSGSEAERTVVARLYGRAQRTPERLAYTWLADGETAAETLTWGALLARAERVAGGLSAAGLVPGDRALLLFPPGLDFLVGFFGCLLAGVVAVPAYPPRSLRRPEREGERLAGVAADAAPLAVLTTSEIAAAGPALSAGVPALLGLPWLSFSESSKTVARGEERSAHSVLPEATAFLQYTSGSTSEPKGVIVSHANLAANLEAIRAAFAQDEDSVVVGWLPLYHDMGLIGNVLQPLWSGGRCVLMSPVSFLQRPARWLEAIDRYRATTSGGPDFAYALAARKTSDEEAARLDLSSWQVAFSGAEPVRAETLERFSRRFAPSGFRSEAFYPCYGLAEATLFVAGPDLGRPPRVAAFDASGLEAHEVRPAVEEESATARRLVSCGHAWAGQRIAIVETVDAIDAIEAESGQLATDGRIGEIWVSGPSIAAGYRHRPEANAATFGARLAGEPEPYLRTGDLGFLHEGELFVTGRLKDLVILRGRNHYPQDLERTAEGAHPDLVAGNSAAFSVERGEGEEREERLVLVAEVSRHVRAEPAVLERIVEAIRTAIADRHEVQVADVRLLSPGALPKTTSGKVRRGATRAAYLAGALGEVESRPSVRPVAEEKVAAEASRDPLAALTALHTAAARALRLPVERLDPKRPLTAQGLDSLSGIEFQLAAEALGCPVSIADLLDGASLADLAERSGLALTPGPSALTPGPSPRGRGEQSQAAFAVLPSPSGRGAGGEGWAADSSPLSLEQEALWAAEQLAPGAYTIAVAAVAEDLDSEMLVRAVETAIARHPALGARFSAGENGPIQHFGPPRLETIRESVGSAELTERLSEIAFRPFDLEQGPLVRLALLESETIALTFSVHHLVADFTSLALLAGEVAAIYAAEVACRLPKLSPLSDLHPADLIDWRRERLEALDRGPGSPFESRVAALSAAEDLDLATDRPWPARQSFRGLLRSRPLDPAAALQFERLARSASATPFTLLTALFSAFLFRSTGQPRFALAAPTSGRSAPGLESLVGYLVQPAAIPVDLGEDPTFAVHLDRTRTASAAAVASADNVPFALLAERLRPRRDPARPRLAQGAVAFERGGDLGAFSLGIEGAEIALGGIRLRALPFPERRVPFELALHAAQVGETLHLALQANAELFDLATIERWLGQLGLLLADMAERPAARLSELHLLSAAERAELLAAAVGPHRPAPPSAAAIQLDDLVAHWETATPEALAVADPAGSLTYGELGARANRLAWRLRELGIAEESRVAICLDRSVDLIVAELAALRVGAAFAPIDPAYPEARRGDMVALSGAATVVTRSDLAGSWCGVAPILALDAEPSLRSAEPVAAPPRRKNPEGLAYAIFTSGSTGRPKGVAMSHRGALHIVSWHLERFGWTSADRGSQVSGPSFDAAVIEIWPALASGASLHVPPADVRLSAPDLLAWFARERLTVAWSPTPLVELFAGEPQPVGLRLRFLQTGGDRLLQGAPADARYVLCNQYGPAENAVITSQGESAAADGHAGAVPPIGRPITGVRAYVLDRWQGLAPRGSGGELGVAGEGLARGYLGDPAQTAERFVPEPFSGEPGGRMYRTGDRVRQRPDGALDFLGRIDAQVKIRGQRIELGEIEAALLAEPEVAAATVVLFGAGVEKRLAAYLVATSTDLDFDRLRARLRTKLPEVMVPGAFVELPALPLTPNGKIDRRALPEPQFGRGTTESFEPPRSPAEEILAAIFGEVLGVETPIGRNDDLLGLGLHSLTASRAAARVSRALGRELPLAALFELPTVAALAEKLTEGSGGAAPLPSITACRRGERAPLTFPQRRLWFLERLLPGRATYHVAGAVDFAGARDEWALDGALALLIARHEALRAAIPDEEGEPFQISAAAAFGRCPRIDLSALGEGGEVERLSRSLARRPFDIAAGPLVRFAEITQGKSRARLVAIFHHLICDGAALELFLGELFSAYAALSTGATPNLPPAEFQLADVARWQAATITPERTEESLAYFRTRLADLEPLELPSDRPRGARRRGRGKTVAARFGEDLKERLAARARSAGATPFMLWVAALQALLARLSGRAKTAIGTPVANRRTPEFERVFGFVANTLVLDAETGDDPSAAELIERVRAGALAAYAREDLPFELLVEALAPRRDLAQNPLFDVLISLEPPLLERQAEGLKLTPRRLDTGTAKLDLSLAVVPTASGFEVWAEHDADLFEAATIARWLGGYERLLSALVDSPERRVSEFPLLGSEERAQLLAWSAESAGDWSRADLLHARFFAVAERTPNALALVGAEQSWSYGELSARALAIARALAARGVKSEERVGVLLSRGPELVAALLGVLAAGGTYVPLDPAYPEERLRFLLEDSGARICLAEKETAGLVPDCVLVEDLLAGAEGDACVAPTEDSSGAEGDSYIAPKTDSAIDDRFVGRRGEACLALSSRHLAYLIYTSGSTGRPKSVAIEHGTAAGFVSWALSAFSREELSAVLFATSVCFDLSVFELFAPLSSGGALVLADNALDLVVASARHPVTLINTVPSALGELVRTEGLPESLQTVNLAGEALPAALVERIFASSPNVARVNNLYGPSEDTTYSTWVSIPREESGAVPPIGRPLPGTQGYAVGRWGELLPPGVPGELRLGGLGLARGYLERPELTAERFVPDPFSGVPGARLYATGDRVRWSEIDSARPVLFYLGRIDNQVKVRGFRVELGEVETALAAGQNVREAAAAVLGEGGDRRLVAFVAGEVDAAELLADLRGRLPGYLVPSALTVLATLPRLPNGKLDRKELAKLSAGAESSAEYVAPRNGTEAALAELFAEVLGVERVGVFDDFFALGGHSLLAARAMARIARRFGKDLPLAALFEAPTVASLEKKAQGRERSDKPSADPSCRSTGRSRGRSAARVRAGAALVSGATRAGRHLQPCGRGGDRGALRCSGAGSLRRGARSRH